MYHVAGTVARSTGKMRICVNGQPGEVAIGTNAVAYECGIEQHVGDVWRGQGGCGGGKIEKTGKTGEKGDSRTT